MRHIRFGACASGVSAKTHNEPGYHQRQYWTILASQLDINDSEERKEEEQNGMLCMKEEAKQTFVQLT